MRERYDWPMSTVLAWIAGMLVAGCGGSCGGDGEGPARESDAAPAAPDAGAAQRSSSFDFPDDHRLHRGLKAETSERVETLRFSGVLDADGSDEGIGYAIVLTQRWSDERGRFEYTYDVAITDQSGEELVRESFDLLGAPRMRSDRQTREPIWMFTQGAMRVWHKEQRDVWEVRVGNGKSGNQLLDVWLTLTNRSQGYQPTPHDGETGRRYEHPALATRGNLKFAGESVSVSGMSRFEHYWGRPDSAALGGRGSGAPVQKPSSPSAVEDSK